MTTSASSTLREAGTSQPRRRRFGRRLSAKHVLIAVVVILAFVLNLLVLSDRGSTILVAVASEPIPVGSTFDRADIELVPLSEGFQGLGALVTEVNLSAHEGFVFTRPISADAPVLIDALGAPAAPNGLRTMSLPVPLEHAAGGEVAIGDTVDVISVVASQAAYVARDLEVVGVSDSGSGSIGSVSQFHILLAVDESEALALAEALDSGSLEVIKTTGAGG